MFYSLFLSLLCTYLANGLYFHIGEQEKKCFVEEIPDETLIVGKYRIQVYDYHIKEYAPSAPDDLGMHVDIRDPGQNVILSRTYASEGRFTFTSHTAGEHVICLHSNSSAWYAAGQLRVHLDIQTGDHAVNYQQIQGKEKLTDLQVRVRQLLNQVEQISREQNYQRFREDRFRRMSESTNSRALWWAVGQVVVLVVMGIWQMKHLRSFFEAKKLV